MHACMIIQLFANYKFYSKILIEHNSDNCGKSRWEKKIFWEKEEKNWFGQSGKWVKSLKLVNEVGQQKLIILLD
jgi:hypothetical protein